MAGTLAAAQASTTGKHAARNFSREIDDTGEDPSVGEEGNARREEWQEILGDGNWMNKVLAEEGGEVGTAGWQGGGVSTGIKYIKDQLPTPFEATAAEGKLLDSTAASGELSTSMLLFCARQHVRACSSECAAGRTSAGARRLFPARHQRCVHACRQRNSTAQAGPLLRIRYWRQGSTPSHGTQVAT